MQQNYEAAQLPASFCSLKIQGLSTENGILLPKLFWPNVRKNCSIDLENFEINRTIYSNSERSEQFLVTECLFLKVSHEHLEFLEFLLEKNIGI